MIHQAKSKSTKISQPEVHKLWGHDPEMKDHNSFRVAFNNIQGISTDCDFSTLKTQIEYTRGINPDILLLAEPNLNFKKADLDRRIKKAIKPFDKFQSTLTASVNDSSDTEHQWGGVMSVLKGRWTPGLNDKGSDKYGRWTWHTIRGKQGYKLTIVSTYRCHRNITNSGSVYNQEYRAMLRDGIENPNPRSQYFKDLSDFIGERHDEDRGKHGFIIGVDANESLQENGAFQRFMDENLLSCCHSAVHPSVKDTPTAEYGSDRIDFILASDNILEHVKRAGILPLHQTTQSDHRMLFIDINIEEVLKGTYANITHPATRKLRLDNPEVYQKYIKDLERLCRSHHLLDKITAMTTDFDNEVYDKINGRSE